MVQFRYDCRNLVLASKSSFGRSHVNDKKSFHLNLFRLKLGLRIPPPWSAKVPVLGNCAVGIQFVMTVQLMDCMKKQGVCAINPLVLKSPLLQFETDLKIYYQPNILYELQCIEYEKWRLKSAFRKIHIEKKSCEI